MKSRMEEIKDALSDLDSEIQTCSKKIAPLESLFSTLLNRKKKLQEEMDGIFIKKTMIM